MEPRTMHPFRICVKTLPNVYNPQEKLWIRLESASAEQLIDQVAKCPSGALSIKQDHRMLIRFEREDNGKKGRFIIYTIKKEFLDSAPSVILSAAAARTKRICLLSAVKVCAQISPKGNE